MPLNRLFKKITSMLTGKTGKPAAKKAHPPASKTAAHAHRGKSSAPPQHKPHARRPAPSAPARHAPGAPASTPASTGRAAGGDAGAPREARHGRDERGGRDRGPRGGSRGGSRGGHGRSFSPSAGHTAEGTSRPGGAIDPAERERRREAHSQWDPASYQVEPAEGKRRFHEFDLPAEIMHAIAGLGFQYCTPVQALSLEHALAGRDITGKAQTGTGKTAAFLIAILTRYLRSPEARKTEPGQPRALVLAPTRELVIQICKDADALGKYCNLRYLAIYGGMDYNLQQREIQAEPVDLIVATPGRLIDFTRSGVVNLGHVDTLVIDEADRMLDMGFIPDVRRIVTKLPPAGKRCTMLYSATLNDIVLRLAGHWMSDPFRVEVESETVTLDTIRQVVYAIPAREKIVVLYNLLRLNPAARVLVFCNRRTSTEHVTEKLRRLGVHCDIISGDVQQNHRLRVLESFRSGEKLRVVIATDVAGRGIHVDNIEFVVNYDFPYEAEDYVHRIGRTGRAGNTGTAISFADEDESFVIPQIEKFINMPLKCTQPDEELLAPLPAKTTGRGSHAHPPRREDPATCRQDDTPTSRQDDLPTSQQEDLATCRQDDTPTSRQDDTPPSRQEDLTTCRQDDTPTSRQDDTPTSQQAEEPPPPPPMDPAKAARMEKQRLEAEQRRAERRAAIERRIAEQKEEAARRKVERMAAAERMNADRHEAAVKRRAELAAARQATAERHSQPEQYEAAKKHKPRPPARPAQSDDETLDASSSIRHSNWRASRAIPPPILIKGPQKSEEWTPGG